MPWQTGDLDAARRMAQEAEGRAPSFSGLVGEAFAVLVMDDLGDIDGLRAAVLRLEPFRGHTVVLSAMVDHCGSVDHFLAVGYAALRDPRAEQVARAALQHNEALGCGPWIARSRALVERLASGY